MRWWVRFKDISNKKAQFDKFKEAAREAGSDEREELFEDRLRRIAELKPKPEKETPDK